MHSKYVDKNGLFFWQELIAGTGEEEKGKEARPLRGRTWCGAGTSRRGRQSRVCHRCFPKFSPPPPSFSSPSFCQHVHIRWQEGRGENPYTSDREDSPSPSICMSVAVNDRLQCTARCRMIFMDASENTSLERLFSMKRYTEQLWQQLTKQQSDSQLQLWQ